MTKHFSEEGIKKVPFPLVLQGRARADPAKSIGHTAFNEFSGDNRECRFARARSGMNDHIPDVGSLDDAVDYI